MAIYTIFVRTGVEPGSGTDANVYIQLHGSDGVTETIFLDDPTRDDFENGNDDDFEIEVPDLGYIEGIVIGHDNTGDGPGWYLDSVMVRNEDTEEEWEFIVDRWLAVDEEDGAIECAIFEDDDEDD